MKANQSQHDLEQRPEGQDKGQGHELMVGRLETVIESEEKENADEQPDTDSAPPQYARYSNNNDSSFNNNINNIIIV